MNKNKNKKKWAFYFWRMLEGTTAPVGCSLCDLVEMSTPQILRCKTLDEGNRYETQQWSFGKDENSCGTAASLASEPLPCSVPTHAIIQLFEYSHAEHMRWSNAIPIEKQSLFFVEILRGGHGWYCNELCLLQHNQKEGAIIDYLETCMKLKCQLLNSFHVKSILCVS